MWDPGTGLSLTRRDPAGREVRVGLDLAVRDRVDPAGLVVQDLVRGRVGLVVRDLADLADMRGRVGQHPADLVGLVGQHPADPVDMRGRVDLVVRHRVDLAGLVVPVGLVGLVGQHLADLVDMRGRVDLVVRDLAGLVGQHPADLVDMRGRVDPVVRDRVDLVDLLARVGLADMRGLVVRVGLDPAAPVDLADPVDPVDPVDLHRRLTGRVALSTGAVPRWVAPTMRRTASAHPTTVRRPRRRNADSAGMAGLRPEGRRLTGSGRHPRVAGTALRLPAVGTAHGMGRRAT